MTEKQLFANTKLEKPQIADEQQIIYLDFDGANTSYRNTILDLNLSVKVKDSGLTQERIDEILLELNRQYAADNVLFVSTIPVEEEFSTIYIGETESFKPYGEFYGLAETIDTDNLIRNDNAFVLMDQSHSNLSIISVIAHETDHIVKGIAHEEETVSVESSEMEDDSPVSKEPVSETLSAFAAKYELVWEDEDNFDMVETTYSKSAGTRHDYDNWYPEFYNGADKIVITITNKACYSSQYASSFSTSLKVDFVGQNDYRFAQLNVPLSITMYPDDNFSLKISQATVSLGTERQRTGSVTNHYTITVRHYKAKESGPVISISADTDSWTQSGVRVNANVSSGGHPVSRIEYSYDQVRWFNGGSVNMTYNGTVYFRATDTAGNVTNSSYTVSNIDYTAPNMEVYGSVLHWTTSKVGVTATAKDWGSDLSHIEYSYDNKNWRAGSFINMTYNGTIYFRATDHAGNTTTRSYTVRNIDNTAPNLIVEGNVSSWTKNNVVLTAQGSDWGSGLKNFAYSYDNKTWHSGSKVNMNYNGTIYFRATDNAGNLQTQSVTVSKIDKTAPTLQLSKSSTSWSRNSVWVTAYANDWGSGVKKIEYSYDNKNWKTGSSVNMDYNGTIYFRATDHAGNVSSSLTTVNSIDRSAPTINVIGNPTAWTNGTAVLTAQGSDWGSGVKKIEYSYDNWNWKTGSTVSMNYNGTIYFRATDNIGNTSSTQVSTSKFYGTPAVDIKSILNGWTNSSVPLWVSYTSDISKIEYSYDNRNWKTGNSLNMTYNGTIYFRTTDRWGNTKTSSYTVSNIDKTAPTLSLSGHTYDWNKGPLTIKVQTNDWGSGVKKIEYSYDGTKWFVGNTVNMDYSGWIHFRVTDNAGNTNSMSVPCYIDKTAPTLTVTKEYNGWTKGSVNFNASANDWGSGVKKIEYSYDNRNWQIGTTVNMNYNGTIYFRATDNAGNVTVESATMDKVDQKAPELQITGNLTAWTNGDTTLAAHASDWGSGINKIEYSYDNTKWVIGNTVKMGYNGTIYFRATDNVGLSRTNSVTITKIDKTAPTLTLTKNVVNGKLVKVSAHASDWGSGINKIEYSYDTKKWFIGTSVDMTYNGIIYFKATDKVGNITIQNMKVDTIQSSRTSAGTDFTATASDNDLLADWETGTDTRNLSGFANSDCNEMNDDLVTYNDTIPLFGNAENHLADNLVSAIESDSILTDDKNKGMIA